MIPKLFSFNLKRIVLVVTKIILFVVDPRRLILFFAKVGSFLGFNIANYEIIENYPLLVSFFSIFIMYLISSFIGILLYTKLGLRDIDELNKIEKKWKKVSSIISLFVSSPGLFAIYYRNSKYVSVALIASTIFTVITSMFIIFGGKEIFRLLNLSHIL